MSLIPTKVILYGAGGIITVGGLFYIANRMKKNKEKADANEAREVLGTDTRAGRAVTVATILRPAIAGWNTKEDIIYDQFKKAIAAGYTFGDISKAYELTYQRDLLKDLQRKLNDREYAKLSTILTGGLSGVSRIGSPDIKALL